MKFTRFIHKSQFALALMLVPVWAVAASSNPASVLRRMQDDAWVTRSFTLQDLGLNDAVLLNGFDSRQEFFLPLPKNLPLAEASIEFNGRYYRAEEGRTSMVLSVNGRPAYSRRVDSPEGDASQVLKVDTGIRFNGFMRLGVQWVNNTARRICEIDRATGNVLSVSQDTRFNYRFSSSSLTNLADAWMTLPKQPVLLVSSKNLHTVAYNSAWRLGVALEQFNRRPLVRSFPVVGDVVDTSSWQVPSGLAALPAFAGLAEGSPKYQIRNEAEVGALLVLGAPVATGDVLVMDGGLRQQINRALDALAAQIAGDGEASRAFSAWRDRQSSAVDRAPASHQLRLAKLGGRPVIVVAEDAGEQAAGMFSETWRNLLNVREVTVNKADQPQVPEQGVFRLDNWADFSTNLEVISKADWTVNLPLSALVANGRVPSELVLDVAAAPGVSTSQPVVSVFWNNYLLSAKRMDANGRPERLDTRIPGYALALNNVLRVSFQRQPYSADCNETPQGFPARVLPSSLIRHGEGAPDGTFAGVLPLMAGAPQVIVPASYLTDAPNTLMHVIRAATALGVTPIRAELSVDPGTAPFSPSKPFLAFQVPIAGASPKVETKGSQLLIHGHKADWLDADGLAALSAMEVVSGNGRDGVRWSAIGAQPAVPQKSFLLSKGDVAVISGEGAVNWVDSVSPEQRNPAGASAFYEWRHYLTRAVPVLTVGTFLLLVLFIGAYRLKRRRDEKKASHT